MRKKQQQTIKPLVETQAPLDLRYGCRHEYYYPFGEEKSFRKAENSFEKAHSILIDRVVFSTPPESLLDHIQVEWIDAFEIGDGKWLQGCRRGIIDAIDSGNEDFFLEIARAIKQRNTSLRKGQPHTRLQRELDVARAIVSGWLIDLLWLMPAPTGAAYVTRFLECRVTEAAFTKTRQRWRLFQHPKFPVTTFTRDGAPVFGDGWTGSRSWVSS